MREEPAPGLVADWLNAWLAAIGVTVLLPEARLSWSDTPVPTARFGVPDGSPPLADALAAALPSLADLQGLAIARQRPGLRDLQRRVDLETYAERANAARLSKDLTLSATVTDLVLKVPESGLPHAPFDPSVPRGITLWQRAVSCREAIVDPAEAIAATLAGRGRRIPNNGLGFDTRRLVAGVQSAEKRVDPVIELLAFTGIQLFPIRGDGTRHQARGWTGPESYPGSFHWCAWSAPLGMWGIDAVIDSIPQARADVGLALRLGMHAWYHSVPYRVPPGSADPTRAYGSERCVAPAHAARRAQGGRRQSIGGRLSRERG